MSSDVVLTAALRNNLLTLQSTQRSIDQTQLRLATGLKVNSALDNPQNFFAAQSLNNRASDLTRLLDGISQSIRTVETANEGVESLTRLVEQADSITQSARDQILAAEDNARLVGDVNLSDENDLVDPGFSGGSITAGSNFDIVTTDSNGDQITETITINDGDSAASLAAQITNAFADDQDGEITARLTDDGFLEIESVDGRSFRIEDDVAAGNAVGLAGFQALGFTDQFVEETQGAAGVVASATVVGGSQLTSISIYEGAGDLAEAGDNLDGATFQDADGNTIISGLAIGDTIDFTVDGENEQVTIAAGTTFQDIVDTINDPTGDLANLVRAEFDTVTGQFQIEAISGEATNIEIGVTAAAAFNFDLDFGDTTGDIDDFSGPGGAIVERNFAFSTSSGELEALAQNYNEIRNQIDRIVVDSNYRGINLLQEDDLVTTFNETRTSRLTTEGVDFSADGLGLTEASFSSNAAIETSSGQVREALNRIRAFGNTLANDISIIQTRRDFTENIINTLESGADDLTVADTNEEGANLLALQTRQALGVTSLSLASQSQQSVLRLF